MGLFSRAIPLSSNAPRHWPSVEVQMLDPVDRAQRVKAVLVSLLEGFQAKGLPVQPLRALQFRMFPEGIIEIPLELEEGGKKFALFIYPESNPESAAEYAAVRQILRDRAGVTAIYYCPAAIQPAKPAVLNPIESRLVWSLGEDDAAPEGDCALWWATEEQPRFSESPARASITTAYKAFDRIEPWLFMALVTDLSLMERAPEGPVRLPQEPLIHPVQGPDGRSILLCASEEKGISFAFPIDSTPITYRDLFLKHYAAYCEALASGLSPKARVPLVESDETPLGWWEFMTSVVEKQEAEGVGGLRVGMVVW